MQQFTYATQDPAVNTVIQAAVVGAPSTTAVATSLPSASVATIPASTSTESSSESSSTQSTTATFFPEQTLSSNVFVSASNRLQVFSLTANVVAFAIGVYLA